MIDLFHGDCLSKMQTMAAVRNERSFIGCELEQGYFDIAKDRIESASCTLESFFE